MVTEGPDRQEVSCSGAGGAAELFASPVFKCEGGSDGISEQTSASSSSAKTTADTEAATRGFASWWGYIDERTAGLLAAKCNKFATVDLEEAAAALFGDEISPHPERESAVAAVAPAAALHQEAAAEAGGHVVPAAHRSLRSGR